MEEQKKSYYAIIPANVRYDRDLPPNAKLLYGEITALCNEKGFCWATNNYFAELYGVSKTTISRWLRDLKNKGYISIEMIYKEGSKEIDNRYIRICGEGIYKNDNTPIVKNVKDNNTINNNTKNNTLDNIYSPAKAEQHIPYKEIIDYLNMRTGSNYRHTTQKTRDLIKARYNESLKSNKPYTLDDFKTVIDKKCVEWFNDENMNKYLRPETLFGTKFEGYLNQTVTQKKITTKDIQIDISDF